MFLVSIFGFSQNFWKQTQTLGKEIHPARVNVDVVQLYEINIPQLRQVLQNAPDRASGAEGVIIQFPNAKGKMESYKVYEASNFAPELQAQFPDIRSYVGQGIEDKTAYLRFSVTPQEIQTMVLRADYKSEFIEPYTTDKSVYVLFNSRSRDKGDLPWDCHTDETDHLIPQTREMASSAQSFKTFRLALSCTGEYTTYHGGTVAGALTGMNATMTRVNGVYEKDLSVNLLIIAGTTNVIYTNASTDPYSTASVGTDPANANTTQGWNLQLQNTLTSVLGNEVYDIGHLFGASGGGGNAGCIGCVCVDDTTSETDKNKGSGYTSPSNSMPEGDTFDIDYVAHEMGHQLGANHSFTHSYEGTIAQVEPGSGSTIMGYAGITDYNVQMNSDDYFTYKNILQIQTNLQNKACAVSTAISNQLPVLNVGAASVTIPKGTPFKLTGTATDPENNALTYCWEQNNAGSSATTDANSVCSATKAAGPNFRSFIPVSSGTRYFPQFSSVLAGQLYNQWESLNTIARALIFTMTVRDVNPNNSQTVTASKVVSVNGTYGPFKVNYPALNTAIASGSTFDVTWDVANTTASPFNVANVKISLSTDNGVTFTTIHETTPNDGAESITLPTGVSTQNAYVMIESIGNVFYNVSGKFLIGYTSTISCNTYNYTGAAVTIPDGVGANQYGAIAYSTLALPATSGNVSSARVTVNVTHPYIQDLVIGILNPQNTDVYLWGRQCNGEDNIQATFSDNGTAVVCATPVSGIVLPYESLTGVNGNPQVGNWKLFAADGYNTDSGVLNSWSLEVCTTLFTPMSVDNNTFTFFNLYPNPSKGIFNINLNSNNNENTFIQLYDLSGRLISNKLIETNQSELSATVDFSSVAKGIYLMKVSKGNEMVARQIVIE